MTSATHHERLSQNPVAFTYSIAKELKWWAFGALTAVVLAEGLGTLLTLQLKYIVDYAQKGVENNFQDVSSLWFWGMAYPLTFFIDETIWRCSGFCGMQWITKTRAAVSRKLFAHLTWHSSTYFNERFAGALTNKISNASQGTGDLISTLLWEFLPLAVTFVWSSLLASWADIRLGLILGGWVIGFLAINVYMVLRKQIHAYAVAEQASILKGKMVDTTSNISAVHQYGHYAYEHTYVNSFIDKHRRAELKKMKTLKRLFAGK
jgi:ATP-binding cassette subfamily B protein